MGKKIFERITDPVELLQELEWKSLFTRDNLVLVQKALYDIGRKDLIKLVVDYAQQEGSVMYCYPASQAPGNHIFTYSKKAVCLKGNCGLSDV